MERMLITKIILNPKMKKPHFFEKQKTGYEISENLYGTGESGL
jgi:hypothetical protein